MEPKRKILHDGFVRVERDEATGHEIVVATDSVAVFIYDRRSRQVVLLSQSRQPVVREDNPEGVITEVVAGRFDKEIGVKGLVIQEVREETGLTIGEEDVQILNNGVPLALSPGILTERTYVVLVEREFDGEDMVNTERVFGVVGEGEKITRRIIPLADLMGMTFEDMKTWALFQYFLNTLRSRGEDPKDL